MKFNMKIGMLQFHSAFMSCQCLEVLIITNKLIQKHNCKNVV